MAEVKKRKDKSLIASFMIIAVIVFIVLLVAWLIINRKETHISTKKEETGASWVNCKSENPSEPFFASENINSFEHNVRSMFKDNKFDQIVYIYEGVYEDQAIAENASAVFLAKYNKYMSEKNMDPLTLNPIFSTVDNKLKITLHADKNQLNLTTIPLFYINAEEFQKLSRLDAESLGDIYKEKGFSCVYNE